VAAWLPHAEIRARWSPGKDAEPVDVASIVTSVGARPAPSTALTVVTQGSALLTYALVERSRSRCLVRKQRRLDGKDGTTQTAGIAIAMSMRMAACN